jgi:hypothetical protein
MKDNSIVSNIYEWIIYLNNLTIRKSYAENSTVGRLAFLIVNIIVLYILLYTQ